jgi:transcriptional regulator with XRE-family HTH domain
VAKAERNEIDQTLVAQRQAIGELIRSRRAEIGLTLLTLQAKTGINNGNLSKIERGEQGMGARTRTLIAKALSMPAAKLVEGMTHESLPEAAPAAVTPFATLMRARRTHEGMTLAELCEITGVKALRLLKLEHGDEEPTRDEKRLIVCALEMGDATRIA